MEEQIQLKMIQLSQVETQMVRWLWYPFIPYGKLTIIQGDPGDGKSTFILNIAAMLSKGHEVCCLWEELKVSQTCVPWCR